MEKYESEIEVPVARDALKELGVFSIKIKSAQETGYPDRLFLIPGGCGLFIEFKRVGKRPTMKQEMIHARLRHAGYKVEVHDSAEEAMQSIREAVASGRRTVARREVVRPAGGGCALLRGKQ